MANIRHLLSINASASKIYEAITTIDGLQKWWTNKVICAENEGDTLAFYFGPNYHKDMKVTELDPNKEVKWECTSGAPEWVGTTVYFSIEDKGGKNTLRFAHDGWRSETDLMAESNYYWGKNLTSLKNLVENGVGEPTVNS